MSEIRTINDDPAFILFFNSHYSQEEELLSLTPIFDSAFGMTFPKRRILKKKKLSFLDKLRYYWNDLKLWRKNSPT